MKKNLKTNCICFCAYLMTLAAALFLAGSAQAQNLPTTWIGTPGTTNNWDDANNWNYGGFGAGQGVPDTIFTPCIITNGGTAEISAVLSVPTIGQLQIGQSNGIGAVLQVAGTLTVNNTFNCGANAATGTGQALYNLQGGVLLHTTGGDFNVGNGGAGSLGVLSISGSGVCTNMNGNVFIGHFASGDGRLDVADNGVFRQQSGGDFFLGQDGSLGTMMNISGNGQVIVGNNSWFGIGHGAVNGTGTININGSGSLTIAAGTANGNFALADSGGSSGTININGGTLQWLGSKHLDMADSSGTTATVSITSGAFINTVGGSINIGNNGVATITQSGGVFTNTGGDTLLATGGTGTWNISGGTAVANFIHVGNSGSHPGTLNLSGTGLLKTTQTIEIGAGGTGTNTINLNGGTLVVNGIKSDGGGITNIINLNGGVVQAVATNGNFFNAATNYASPKGLTVNVLAGGAVFNANGFAIRVTNNLSGAGGLTNAGTSGSVTLSGANTYSGATLVQAGELIGATPGSSVSAFTVASGATNGVQVNAAGAQLSCGGLTYNSGTTYADFNLGALAPSTTTAPLQVNGNLAFNGTLNVIVRGTAITNAGTYPLIKYTGTLSGTPPTAALSLPTTVLAATLINNTANQSIDLNVSTATYGYFIFNTNSTGAIVGSNAVVTLTVESGATAGGPLVVTVTSGNAAVTASQTVTLAQNQTSTNLSFLIAGVGVSTVTATGTAVAASSVQVTGALPTISLPATTGAVVTSNAVVNLALTCPYPFTGPYSVLLTSDNTAVTASQTVTVPAGATNISVTFPILGAGLANVTATGAGLNSGSVQVTGALPTIILPSSALAAVSSNAIVTLTLTSPYPFTGPYSVTLTSGNTAVTASQTVTVPAGVTNISVTFPILGAGTANVTATGAGLNSASMVVGDIDTVLALGMANHWVGDDYVPGNAWTDRFGGVVAALDGLDAGTNTPIKVPGLFNGHAGVERSPVGAVKSGFSIPGGTPPEGSVNYTVCVVLYSTVAGLTSGNYYGDNGIIGYDIGGGGQTDWGMSYGGNVNAGIAITAGVGRVGGDTAINSGTNLSGLYVTHAIALQTSGGNTLRLYVDGVLANTVTGITLQAPNHSGGVTPLLSSVNQNFSGVFSGALADVRIYTNAAVDAASLTAYLKTYYAALTTPTVTPNYAGALVGTNARATLTVGTGVTANNAVNITLTSDNTGVTASQTVTLARGQTSTNLSFPILSIGIANVAIAGSGLNPTAMQVVGFVSEVWSGVVTNVWDINTTTNWTENGSPAAYLNGAPVVFDDTGINPNVNLAPGISPLSVTVNNSLVSYSFAGGSIGGTGGLIKNGGGTLTISNANSYSGSTVINNGTVQLPAPVAMPAGAVAYYTFDDSANLGADSSGLGNGLTNATGTPVYSPNGVAGGSVYLDGGSTLMTSNTPAGQPIGNSPYTMAVWEKVDLGCSTTAGFLAWGLPATGLQSSNFRLNGPHALTDYFWAGDVGASGIVPNLMDGNWHSVVTTYDGTDHYFYADGVQVGVANNGTGLSLTSSSYTVGRTLGDANFKGWLDNAMIVNRALTAAEVASYYQGIGALPTTTSVQIHGTGVLALNGRNQAVGSLAGDTGATVSLGGGTLTTGGDNTSTAFAGVISGSGSLNKAGTNVFTLSNSNIYSGGTIINSGGLDVQHDGGLGSGNVSVGNGTNAARLILETSAAVNASSGLSLTSPAMVNLAFSGTDTISNLVIGGITQYAGTWGATGSGAANVDDTHFSGTGKLNVTGGGIAPPPSSPTILPVYLDGTRANLVISVATASGYNYILQSTTSLTPPIVWSNISTNAGTGGTITNAAPISSAQSNMFFRYLVQ
jgi:autotransporter-associated beta strand protein